MYPLDNKPIVGAETDFKEMGYSPLNLGLGGRGFPQEGNKISRLIKKEKGSYDQIISMQEVQRRMCQNSGILELRNERKDV